MFWSLAFDRVGVAIADIYFVDPNLDQGAADAERGVRVELRRFVREEMRGSPYSAVPISVGEPLWRIDLLETTDSEPGSLNRAHHHPKFRGWEPSRRVFVEELSAKPVEWVRDRLEHIEEVLADAGVDPAELGDDVGAIRAATPAVVAQLEHMLAEVAAGRAGLAPAETGGDFVRQSWL